jgi:hypothetical protein
MKDRENRNLWSAVGASPSPSKQSEGNLYAGKPLNSRPSVLPDADLDVSSIGTVNSPPTSEPEFDDEETPQFVLPRWLLIWAGAWQFWAIIVLSVAGTAGFVATTALFKLPALPSCPTLFLPLASASVRLYCAQLSADKQTTEALLNAIKLVEALPPEHPLRAEINRNIEEWSVQILDLADEKFQNGELEEAISDARKIPNYVEAYKLVEKRIAKWQGVWDKAKAIVAEAEKLMLDSKWGLAFRAASKLTGLNNRYWATTRYNQLIDQIRLAQEESGKLDKAYALMRQGGTDNLLEAIKLAEQIKPESTAYRESQKLIAEAGDKLLELAMERLEAGDWSAVMDIANRIPGNLKIQEEITDLNNLAEAGSQAGAGTVAGLEAAIAAAKAVPPGRPLYDRAQRLVGRWELEIQDVQTLTKAEELANGGGVNYLTAAIAQARLIPRSNPRYDEAQEKIAEWTRQIQVLEDQPILERADQIASSGGTSDLQQAIDDVRSIDSDRPLYREAQQRSREWQETIERSEDQPYLDRARSLADAGDLPGAISIADSIPRGRALHGEAQNEIGRWRGEIQGRIELDRAFQTAREGTSSALSSAIRAAQQVPSNSTLYNQSVQAINGWSDRLLAMARERANYNLSEAIEIAQMIPDGTSAYPAARSQMEVWQQRLQPQLPDTSPALTDEPSPPAEEENNLIFN